MWRERGIPHRGKARLAVGLITLDHKKLLERGARNGEVRVVGRIAKRVEHQHRVGHGRENSAKPIVAVEPLGNEVTCFFDGEITRRLWKVWL